MVLVKREITRIGSPRKRLRCAETSSSVQNSNVKVFVRVRPLNSSEVEKSQRTVIQVIEPSTLIFDPKETGEPFYYHGVQQKLRDPSKKVNKNLEFNFDMVFGPDSENANVFENTTKDVIKTLFDGYNCSVFSYGATGAGKTYTMLGNETNKGIMYLTMVELYAELENLKEDNNVQLGVAYVEVYNESVHDLLNPSANSLFLREDNAKVMIAGMTIKEINSEEELFRLLLEGNKNRTQHPTDANAESSRSHAIFQVFVKISKKGTDEFKHFKLSMIDLAGSERASATACVGARFKEGSNINKSLLALGNCINALAEGQRYVPYRDSKLTRILKDSLGGNCKTIMIANLSPSTASYEDSYNTLKYADRAKKIKSKLHKNVVSVPLNAAQYKKLYEDAMREINSMKQQNQKPSNSNCTCQSASSAKVKEWREKLLQSFSKKDAISTEFLTLESQKQILQWRIKLKRFDLQRVSQLERNIESSGKGQMKLETSLSQLEGRLAGVMEAISQVEKKLEASSVEIKNMIKELKKSRVYNTLAVDIEKLELTLRINEIEQRFSHGEKLSRLQSVRLDDREQTITTVSNLAEEYFLLLKGFNRVTDEMEQKYKTFWKKMKSVTWDDSDLNADLAESNNFILRPIKLFTTDSAQSSPEVPTVTAAGPGVSTSKVSSNNAVSVTFNPSKSNGSSNMNGTFLLPSSFKLPSPPKSMRKKPASSWKSGSILSSQTPVPKVKFSQQNKENRPIAGARMPPPARTPRPGALKAVAAHLPTPGKHASLSTSMKSFGPSKRRNSINKMLPRESSKRRSLLKALAAANQMSTIQFTKTPARIKKK